MPSDLLARCADLPVREIAAGEQLIVEGDGLAAMYVVVTGRYEVIRHGAVIAVVDEPGAVLGELSVLLDVAPRATVTASEAGRVHVIDDPLPFLVGDGATLLEVTRLLARRLDRLSGYLADLKTQYGDADGHLGLVDEVLSTLTFGEQSPVEPGSEREPDPYP